MSLQKYLLIVLSVFMQFMPIDAKNEIDETDIQDQIEEYNDDKDNNDTIKYLLVAAGVGLIYWYQSPLTDTIMPLFGDRLNEHGQVIINSQKAMAIMNKNQYKHQPLRNVSLKGPFSMKDGQFISAAFADGTYFTVDGVDYVVEN